MNRRGESLDHLSRNKEHAMQRAVTAIYRTHSIADLVRQELVGIGIGRGHITVVPDDDATSALPRTDDDPAMDQLHDLHLPDEDLRTYQQALRNGDYVVSVNVDEEAHLDRVQDIMRRPEDARNLDELDREYAAAEFIPRRDPATETLGSRYLGRRESAQPSPFTRSYGRDEPIRPRSPR